MIMYGVAAPAAGGCAQGAAAGSWLAQARSGPALAASPAVIGVPGFMTAARPASSRATGTR